MTNAAEITAQAIAVATKSNIAHDAELVAQVVASGLPASADFVSPEGHNLRISGETVHMLRDGEIVKSVPLAVIGADRILISYAISRGRIASGSIGATLG